MFLSPLTPQAQQKKGIKTYWGRLYGSSLALALSEQAASSDGPLLLICPDIGKLQRLEYELRFYNAHHQLPIFSFPDWETLPYDHFSPHQDIVSERLRCLYRLPNLKKGIVLVAATTLMHRLPPVSYVQQNTLELKKGDRLDIDEFRRELEQKGYYCVTNVVEHGEFAVRGSIIDLFPMGSRAPYRLDLFDDEVETIKTFDVETQRSTEDVEAINMMPAREFPFKKPDIEFFREQYREKLAGDLVNSHIYNEVSRGIAPAGIEYYLPLFFEQTVSLFEYLPSSTLIAHFQDLEQSLEHVISDANSRYQQYAHDSQRPILPVDELFLRVEEVFAAHKQHPVIQLASFEQLDLDSLHSEMAEQDDKPETGKVKAGTVNFASAQPPLLKLETHAENAAQRLSQFITGYQGRILFVAETAGRRESLLELLKSYQVYPKQVDNWLSFIEGQDKLAITIAPLDHGLLLHEPDIAVIVESQIFGQQVMQRRRRKSRARDSDSIVNSLAELSIGAPVVHEDHGVGRYLGLEKIDIGGNENEFLTLEYAGGDKLYVPVASLHLISRYTGAAPETAPLHKLGSGQWEKAKRKAREKVRDVAAELLDIYARREAQKGHIYQFDRYDYQKFTASFPYEETPDQAEAIDNVYNDMKSDKPMDRLVCGDVGFGKTEVAMRAAFIAAQDGKQVAILVPTTLLSQQHLENFHNRFADWPFRIEGLSRFQTKKQQDDILKGVKEGTVDIIIGTHKLLQDDVKFKDLGLLIIDEEHRFGVRQKEKFKALRSKVDILTLTATPIPRTLNMSLSGIRDFSIIATPPARRVAIKTFVCENNKEIMREAIQREIMRGGQVYLLHNNIDTIEKRVREVEQLIPEATVHFAHGQMREKELESIMADFYHQRYNVLVCTTIIETGIDVPTANTIIIDRADKLGLAQLYQIRGRVGRSHHRAYAYLMIPSKKTVTADALKRLEAIESLEELGAGFTLASHDLEIRGAGELLGDEQSGQMQEIGFSLYTDLLERAVKALKSGKEPALDADLNHGCEIDLHAPCLIPDDYIVDVHTRLVMYKRIANAASHDELRELNVEMIDRFGLLPQPCKNLFDVTALKLKAQSIGINKIDLGAQGGRITFDEQPNIDPMTVIQLIQQQPKSFKMDGATKLRLLDKSETFDDKVKQLNKLLDRLATSH